MTKTTFEPSALFRRSDAVAAQVAPSELFGFFQSTFDLPGGWAALVTREAGDHVLVPDGRKVSRDQAEDILLFRTAPIDLRLADHDLAAKDGLLCDADVRLRVLLSADASDAAQFRQSLVGSRRLVCEQDLAGMMLPFVRQALIRLAGEHAAEALASPDLAMARSEAVLDVLRKQLFTWGVTLDGPPMVNVHSKSLRELHAARENAALSQARHEASRRMREAIERSQKEHVDHLTSMLERLQAMAEASPDIKLHDLMRTFPPEQRGEMYHALFTAEVTESLTQWVVVAAGEELLFFSPSDTERPARRVKVFGEPGPLRSVQQGQSLSRSRLMLGAARGVYLLDDEGELITEFVVPEAPELRGGFNAVALADDRLIASHSELGICAWSPDKPRDPRRLFESMTRSASVVRGVCVHGDLAFAAIDDRVIRWPVASDQVPDAVLAGSRDIITAICPGPDGLIAGTSAGDLLHWPRGATSDPRVLHAGVGRAVESIWLTDSQGIQRVLFTDTSLCVHARVLQEQVLFRYEAGGQTLRRVEVAEDLLVATNDLRDRLLLWRPGELHRPYAQVNIASLVGRSIQDVCLLPREA